MMLEAALEYARRGWPAFPIYGIVGGVCMCAEAANCSSPGKHPLTATGLTEATIDAAVIRRWWDRWPNANIGLRTGVVFDVLDIDGLDGLDALDDTQPDAPSLLGPMVRTGRGLHIYVAVTGRGNRTKMLAQVDWRGSGGYVIAPPSMHYSGVRYEWTDHGPGTELIEAPQWLLDVIDRVRRAPVHTVTSAPLQRRLDRYGQVALEGELGRLLMAREGQRNDALNTAAFALGQLVAGGHLDAGHVVDELFHAAARIGLTEREAERTIESGITSGMNNPRRVAS